MSLCTHSLYTTESNHIHIVYLFALSILLIIQAQTSKVPLLKHLEAYICIPKLSIINRIKNHALMCVNRLLDTQPSLAVYSAPMYFCLDAKTHPHKEKNNSNQLYWIWFGYFIFAMKITRIPFCFAFI